MAPNHRTGPGYDWQPQGRLRQPAHELIGRRLKSHYREIEEQPLPDRINELLQELDRLAPPSGPPRDKG